MVTVSRKEMMAPYWSPKWLTKIYPEKHPKMDQLGSESAGNFSIYIYEINVIYNRL
jgi:hypothetical protein